MEMKKLKTRILFLTLSVLLSVVACKKSDSPTPASTKPKVTKVTFTEKLVDLGTHKLDAFSIIKNSKYLVVFEAGLGDDHSIWDSNDVALKTSDSIDVVSYDRASHGGSGKGPIPRDINRLQSELNTIIETFANGRKIILIGHSLGGLIIRDWAIKNPTRVAALLFVDPSHEAYSKPTQADEDAFYNWWKTNYGEEYGSTLEAREWKNDLEYMATLGNLPDVPVIVLTAMKIDSTTSVEDRQVWYNAHELLKNGVTDFTHITIADSGHMVMLDDPKALMKYIYQLVSRIR